MDVADRISKALGEPKTCPHGNQIDATIEDGSVKLADAEAKMPLTIVKVTDEREEFLTYIYEIGLTPGTEILIEERTPFGDVLSLRVAGNDRPVAVGKEVSTAIFVQPQ